MKQTIPCLLVLAILLTSCRTPSTDATVPSTPIATAFEKTTDVDISSLDVQRYPRVDGSTSALPLQTTLACEILQVHCIWMFDMFAPILHIVPSPGVGDIAKQNLIQNLWHNGTHGSYMNLINGDTDFILVARQPSQDEEHAAAEANVELEIHAVALDAFVILANVENPVESLDQEEIRAIYTGDVTTWDQVGGQPENISPYQRNRNSGSQELMEKLIMRREAMIDAPEMILEGMMGPINALASDRLGIGYSVYFYATYIYPLEEIKLLAVDGVYPQADTIADRSYPLTTEVYAVIRADTPTEHNARILYEWLLTEEGQEAVARSGYVPLLSMK
jgi:phosphate transport system substrate-binding protein